MAACSCAASQAPDVRISRSPTDLGLGKDHTQPWELTVTPRDPCRNRFGPASPWVLTWPTFLLLVRFSGILCLLVLERHARALFRRRFLAEWTLCCSLASAMPVTCPHTQSSPYSRHEPEKHPLHQVLAAHLETFLERTRTSAHQLPGHVEEELRAYLKGGILVSGRSPPQHLGGFSASRSQLESSGPANFKADIAASQLA